MKKTPTDRSWNVGVFVCEVGLPHAPEADTLKDWAILKSHYRQDIFDGLKLPMINTT